MKHPPPLPVGNAADKSRAENENTDWENERIRWLLTAPQKGNTATHQHIGISIFVIAAAVKWLTQDEGEVACGGGWGLVMLVQMRAPLAGALDAMSGTDAAGEVCVGADQRSGAGGMDDIEDKPGNEERGWAAILVFTRLCVHA